MKINTDHYFTGKNRHKPCEDYALSGLEPLPYVIAADGCSSSQESHIGALLLAQAARNEIQKRFGNNTDCSAPDYSQFGRAVIRQASFLSRFLNLPPTALDTTLLIGFYTDEHIFVYVYGDGFVIAKHRNDPVSRIVDISFETNAPYYLSYQLYEERNRQYGLEMNGMKIIQSQGEYLTVEYNAPVFYKFPVREFSTVILASDGLGAFVDSENLSRGILPASDVIKEFTAFKNFNGEFVKRRARRAVNTYEKSGVVIMDDISIAAIYMELDFG